MTTSNTIKTNNQSRKTEEVRATFVVNKELHEKLRAMAYYERRMIKEFLNRALTAYVRKYEKRNGRDYYQFYTRQTSPVLP